MTDPGGSRRWAMVVAVVGVTAALMGVLVARPWAPRAPPPPAEPPWPEERLRPLIGDPALVHEGKQLYAGICVACHGAHGEGLQGPNLRDDYWINGSDLRDIVAVISDGRPAKGMAGWRGTYTPAQIRALAVYVVSLAGGSGGTAKAPEGTFRPIPTGATVP